MCHGYEIFRDLHSRLAAARAATPKMPFKHWFLGPARIKGQAMHSLARLLYQAYRLRPPWLASARRSEFLRVLKMRAQWEILFMFSRIAAPRTMQRM